MVNYNKNEILNMYRNNMISKSEKDLFMGMIGMEKEVTKRIGNEEILKSSDPKLIEKCMSKDIEVAEPAYQAYRDRERAEVTQERRDAAEDIETITKELESYMRTTIRKAGVSKNDIEVAFWTSHPAALEQYEKCQRILIGS